MVLGAEGYTELKEKVCFGALALDIAIAQCHTGLFSDPEEPGGLQAPLQRKAHYPRKLAKDRPVKDVSAGPLRFAASAW
jgi:hypothetical protein